MKVTHDTGMLTLKHGLCGAQIYHPIITLKKDRLTLSFSTVLVISRRTWLFDWSVGFQILGFGFGVCKYMENA